MFYLFEFYFFTNYTKIISGLDYPESMALYVVANERIEKISEFLYFIVLKVAPPCVIFPKLFASLHAYSTTDLGSEAFKLPLPMWFVRYSLEITFYNYNSNEISLCLFKFEGSHLMRRISRVICLQLHWNMWWTCIFTALWRTLCRWESAAWYFFSQQLKMWITISTWYTNFWKVKKRDWRFTRHFVIALKCIHIQKSWVEWAHLSNKVIDYSFRFFCFQTGPKCLQTGPAFNFVGVIMVFCLNLWLASNDPNGISSVHFHFFSVSSQQNLILFFSVKPRNRCCHSIHSHFLCIQCIWRGDCNMWVFTMDGQCFRSNWRPDGPISLVLISTESETNVATDLDPFARAHSNTMLRELILLPWIFENGLFTNSPQMLN